MLKYKIKNFVDDQRIETINGIQGQILAIIYVGSRRFLVYKILLDGQVYIEEIISNKISDNILLYGEDSLVEVELKLWQILLQICTKEGIISATNN